MEIIDRIRELFVSIYEIISEIFDPFFNLIIKYYLDNPMFKIILAFVPAILSIAYPLIIQTISKLNNQYKSTHIINQFKKENLHLFFLWSLIVSVALTMACFVLSIKIFLIAFLSVIVLIVSFFLYLNLLLKYQNGQDLFNLYVKRLNLIRYRDNVKGLKKITRDKKRILSYWYPIIDLLKYSIRNQDRKLENDIKVLFIYEALGFIQFQDQKNNELVLFPTEIYNSSFDIVSEYIRTNEKDYYQDIESFIGPILFPANYNKTNHQYIHYESYNAIWRNLVVVIENQRIDKIKRFWSRAHQYCDLHLNKPISVYDDNFKETPESIEKRNKANFHRDIFIQFNTAIGAYLMYKKECEVLKYLWFFSNSEPPRYAIIPGSSQEIFELFIKFKSHEIYETNIIIRFWFRDLAFDEMGSNKDVKMVVGEYIVLLFLRLYIIKDYYGNNPISVYPKIPYEQSEKQNWIDYLGRFKHILKKYLDDEELIKCLGLDIITKENCLKNNFDFPLDYIDNFITQIKDDSKITLEDSPLDDVKIKKMNEKTVASIKDVFNDISRIKGSNIEKKNRDKISERMEVVRGTRMLLDREAFLSNTSVHYLNADEMVGAAIKREYYHHFITKIVLQKKKAVYQVPNGQLFEAIEKLNPDSKKYVILSFGVNINYQKDFKGIEIEDSVGDENYKFNSIPIYCFDFGYSQVYGTICLIKTSNLPMIKHGDWSEVEGLPEKTKDRWTNMDMIDEELKIYSKIKELNKDGDLRTEYMTEGKNEENLKKFIEYDVDFLGYIWFNKDSEIIEIQEAKMFEEGGATTIIDEIDPLE